MTTDVRKYLDTRLGTIEKIVTDADTSVVRCQVELGRSAKHAKQGVDQWFATLDIKVKKFNWHATATAESVKAAIDIVKDEIVAQIRKEKAHHRKDVRKGAKKVKELVRTGKSK